MLFLASPSKHSKSNKAHHTGFAKVGQLRMNLKRCRSPAALMNLLNDALQEGIIESSIFSAAMQTCGYRCWWQTLQKVRDVQLQTHVELDSVGTSIGITAITGNLRSEGLFDVLQERKEPALRMAKDLWQEAQAWTNPVVLSGALKLCTQLDCPAGWQWGQQIWQQSEDAGMEKGPITYSTYITMLEKYGEFAEVDRLLDFDEHLSPVLLGALVDMAGRRQNLARADAIWEKMVVEKKVQPIESSYNAYARAYLVSGDPEMAIAKMEEMLERSVGHFTWINAKDHAQALLILYHSMPTDDNKERLQRFLQSSQVIFATGQQTGGARQQMDSAPRTAVEEWQKLCDGAEDLLQRPEGAEKPPLHEVLLTWRASSKSRMAMGPNFPFAGDYLPHHEGVLKPLSATAYLSNGFSQRSGENGKGQGKGRSNGYGKGQHK